MPEIDARLLELLSDEAQMKKLTDLAAALRGQNQPQRGAHEASGSDAPPADAPAQPAFDTSQLLASLLSSRTQAQAEAPHDAPPAPEPAAAAPAGERQGFNMSAILDILPQLLSALTGEANGLPAEKVNLVNAIRPYASSRAESLDRALKMAGIAKAAKSAIGSLNNT